MNTLPHSRLAVPVVCVSLFAFSFAPSAGGQCEPGWDDAFPQPSTSTLDTSAPVRVLYGYDNGVEKALYAGGSFPFGRMEQTVLAKWDGHQWSALLPPRAGSNQTVTSLISFDSGGGLALYVGGSFVMSGDIINVAKLDGATWAPLGQGLSDWVQALIVFDDGAGPALYAGGSFDRTGQGTAAHYIAKWNGSTWSAVGPPGGPEGVSDPVSSMVVFDDGAGPALYVGGDFTHAGGIFSPGVAKWDGTSWSAVGVDSLPVLLTGIRCMAVFDDGGGPALYIGGSFTHFDDPTWNHIIKWDGAVWSRVGEGRQGSVYALAVFDDGGGPGLYVGMNTFGSITTQKPLSKWDGSQWIELGGERDDLLQTLTVFDDGVAGPALNVGGDFRRIATVFSPGDENIRTDRVYRWKSGYGPEILKHPLAQTVAEGQAARFTVEAAGTADLTYQWRKDGVPLADDGRILGADSPELTMFWLDASDEGIYDAVVSNSCGEVTSEGVALQIEPCSYGWVDGFHPPGVSTDDGTQSAVFDMAVFDNGNGPALYVGGRLTSGGDVLASRIAKWDGAEWSPLGDGVSGGVVAPHSLSRTAVTALAVFSDGTGPALYVGGNFTMASGVHANNIAKWDGTSWSALGEGLNKAVADLVVFDDGGGAALYACGSFTMAGGVPATYIAKWDGTMWSPLDSSTDVAPSALAVFDDGSGPALYAGGAFTLAGGAPVNRVGKWQNGAWSALGEGVAGGTVRALHVFDDGHGEGLFVGGGFTMAGGVQARGVAKWDGSTWSNVGGGISQSCCSSISAMHGFDDGGGPALYVGGWFSIPGAGAAIGLAKWDGAAWSALGSDFSGAVYTLTS